MNKNASYAESKQKFVGTHKCNVTPEHRWRMSVIYCLMQLNVFMHFSRLKLNEADETLDTSVRIWPSLAQSFFCTAISWTYFLWLWKSTLADHQHHHHYTTYVFAGIRILSSVDSPMSSSVHASEPSTSVIIKGVSITHFHVWQMVHKYLLVHLRQLHITRMTKAQQQYFSTVVSLHLPTLRYTVHSTLSHIRTHTHTKGKSIDRKHSSRYCLYWLLKNGAGGRE